MSSDCKKWKSVEDAPRLIRPLLKSPTATPIQIPSSSLDQKWTSGFKVSRNLIHRAAAKDSNISAAAAAEEREVKESCTPWTPQCTTASRTITTAASTTTLTTTPTTAA